MRVLPDPKKHKHRWWGILNLVFYDFSEQIIGSCLASRNTKYKSNTNLRVKLELFRRQKKQIFHFFDIVVGTEILNGFRLEVGKYEVVSLMGCPFCLRARGEGPKVKRTVELSYIIRDKEGTIADSISSNLTRV